MFWMYIFLYQNLLSKLKNTRPLQPLPVEKFLLIKVCQNLTTWEIWRQSAMWKNEMCNLWCFSAFDAVFLQFFSKCIWKKGWGQFIIKIIMRLSLTGNLCFHRLKSCLAHLPVSRFPLFSWSFHCEHLWCALASI